MTLDTRLLRTRFGDVIAAVGATRTGDNAFDDLLARYQQAHRHYHTLEHVDACLAWLDWFGGAAQRRAEVELALWFHDAVYSPRRTDNERRSAELARDQLCRLGVADATVDRITKHIEATAHHASTDVDACLVIDVDLAILGAQPAAFDQFEAQIRREYAHVPEPLYRAGRAHVLQQFLSRTAIFVGLTLRAQLEPAARTNLERRIHELSASP